ncbi:MAG: inositol monophosphatase [Acidimicrobiia bacterium]|nr:inositol monophosphatase [Acidimicrobiia bacterium]
MSGSAEAADLVAIAEGAARQAARLLADAWAEHHHGIASKSSVTDIVTAADRMSEALIVERILAVRPDDAILGEEGGARSGGAGSVVRWVIDPLDGTVNYSYGLAGYAVSIAAEVEGVTVAGVVADVVRGDLYSATRGGGATCNGAPIEVSACSDPALALVATGFGYDPAVRARQGRVAAELVARVRDLRRLGAAAVDLCLVAAGRLDGYYETGLGPWDHAAGALIATEAGALVTDFGGGPPSAEGCLAAPPGLHGALRTLLAAAGAVGRPARDDRPGRS